MDRTSRRWLPILGIATLAPLLADCGNSLDTRRATLCRRALPAIAPRDSTVILLRVGAGPSADSVRVDYRLEGLPSSDTKARYVLCRFGPGAKLESVTTEAGPVSGASVYLLQHYFLDTPEAAAADPLK